MNQNAAPRIFCHQVAYQKIEALHLMGVHLHVVPYLPFWCPLSWLSMTGLDFPKVSSFADHEGASHCLSLHVHLNFSGPCSVERKYPQGGIQWLPVMSNEFPRIEYNYCQPYNTTLLKFSAHSTVIAQPTNVKRLFRAMFTMLSKRITSVYNKYTNKKISKKLELTNKVDQG